MKKNREKNNKVLIENDTDGKETNNNIRQIFILLTIKLKNIKV